MFPVNKRLYSDATVNVGDTVNFELDADGHELRIAINFGAPVAKIPVKIKPVRPAVVFWDVCQRERAGVR